LKTFSIRLFFVKQITCTRNMFIHPIFVCFYEHIKWLSLRERLCNFKQTSKYSESRLMRPDLKNSFTKGYKKLVIVIIRLLPSLLPCPKVIPLSGFYSSWKFALNNRLRNPLMFIGIPLMFIGDTPDVHKGTPWCSLGISKLILELVIRISFSNYN